jgi:hypothetical protein
MMRRSSCLLLVLVGFGSACAPALVAGSMPNPARSKDKIQSTQEYQIGPYKENHRYEVTVTDWMPSSIGVRIKLVDEGNCGLPKSYSFALVDDHGTTYPFKPAGAAAQTTEVGRGGAALTVSTLAGAFDAPIGPDSRTITIQQRSQPDANCPQLDFRWSLQ